MPAHRAGSARGLVVLTLCFLVGPGCIVGIFDDDDDEIGNTDFEAVRQFSESVAAQSRVRVRILAVNGSVEVRGVSDATSVEIIGERIVGSSSIADAEAHVDDLRVMVTSSSSEVVVETRQPSSTRGRRYEVHYVITVPDEFRADVSQVNGAIDIQGPLQDIDVDNVNGSVVASELIDDATVDIVNGRVEVEVLELNGEVDLGSVNGNVEVVLPNSASAEIFADLANGSIRVSGLTLTDQVVTPRSLRGRLGGGLYRVDLETVNGDLVLRGRP